MSNGDIQLAAGQVWQAEDQTWEIDYVKDGRVGYIYVGRLGRIESNKSEDKLVQQLASANARLVSPRDGYGDFLDRVMDNVEQNRRIENCVHDYDDEGNCPACGHYSAEERVKHLEAENARLEGIFADPTALTANILRTWSRDQIERFALHLLGTDWQELSAEVQRLRAALDEAEAKANKRMLALESLTPGGSEFVGDAEACVKHIGQVISNGMDTIRILHRQKRETEDKLEGQQTAIAEALDKLQHNDSAAYILRDAFAIPEEWARMAKDDRATVEAIRRVLHTNECSDECGWFAYWSPDGFTDEEFARRVNGCESEAQAIEEFLRQEFGRISCLASELEQARAEKEFLLKVHHAANRAYQCRSWFSDDEEAFHTFSTAIVMLGFALKKKFDDPQLANIPRGDYRSEVELVASLTARLAAARESAVVIRDVAVSGAQVWADRSESRDFCEGRRTAAEQMLAVLTKEGENVAS